MERDEIFERVRVGGSVAVERLLPALRPLCEALAAGTVGLSLDEEETLKLLGSMIGLRCMFGAFRSLEERGVPLLEAAGWSRATYEEMVRTADARAEEAVAKLEEMANLNVREILREE